MVSISSISKGFNNIVLDNKAANWMYNRAKENPAKFAGEVALVSALTKDLVGCYYYVTQSLNNEKIPEDKRNFVAAIDLMNGILNVGLQFTLGSIVSKAAPKLFNEHFVDKKLDADYYTRSLAKKTTEAVNAQIKNVKEHVTFDQVEKYLKDKKSLGRAGKVAKWLNVGFSAATTLFVTQIFTKRVIVPFLATPLAGWYKEKFLDKKTKKADDTMTPAMVDSTMPKLNIVSK